MIFYDYECDYAGVGWESWHLIYFNIIETTLPSSVIMMQKMRILTYQLFGKNKKIHNNLPCFKRAENWFNLSTQWF